MLIARNHDLEQPLRIGKELDWSAGLNGGVTPGGSHLSMFSLDADQEGVTQASAPMKTTPPPQSSSD
jgi:hypothetical protein